MSKSPPKYVLLGSVCGTVPSLFALTITVSSALGMKDKSNSVML